jgi:hypothetical protein
MHACDGLFYGEALERRSVMVMHGSGVSVHFVEAVLGAWEVQVDILYSHEV